MKENILNSGWVKKLSETKLVKGLSNHRFFGKFVNYEVIMYLIAGVLTTVVNYVVYFLMPRFESNGLDIVLANTVSWIAAVLFAFVVNKIFVFDSPEWNLRTLYREFLPFVAARLLSWGFDTLFLYVTVGLLNFNEPLCKILSNVIVLIMNYVASKFFIFKKKKPAEAAESEAPVSEEDPHEETDA